MASSVSHVWDRFLPAHDREMYARSGWGKRMGFGRRPALLIVDCNYAFCGDRPEPLADSIKRWPTSCGDVAWRAAEAISSLLAVARGQRVPIIYTTGADGGPAGFGAGRWADKLHRTGPPDPERRALGNTIIPMLKPTSKDIVIEKGKPSAFFGSPLAGYLVDLQADSIIVCGGVTSGCVRATVIDAFSYNYRVAVVGEAVFDRGELSHAVNLFDMDEKYADVVSLEETRSYLEQVGEGLFDTQMTALRPDAAPQPTLR